MKKGTILKRRTGTAAWWEKWTRFDPETGCVLYIGFTNPQGYALVSCGGDKKVLAHRLAYEQVHGPIVPGLVICHTCDTPNCVNPQHLFAGTQKDNLRDMFAKGRARPQGKATAPLTVFPSVSGRVLQAQARLQKSKECVSRCQSTSYTHESDGGATTPLWCQVTNVPQSRPTQAIVLWKRPESGTGL